MKTPLIDKDGTDNYESFSMGVPLAWEKYDGIPTSGHFRVTYVCSIDNVRLRTRRRLASDWGGWELPEDNKAILKDLEWWALLDEQPSEVNELSEFLAGMQRLGYVPPNGDPRPLMQINSHSKASG